MWKILHGRWTVLLKLECSALQWTLCGRYFTASGQWYCSLNEVCYREHYVENTSQHVDSFIEAWMEWVKLNIMWKILHSRWTVVLQLEWSVLQRTLCGSGKDSFSIFSNIDIRSLPHKIRLILKHIFFPQVELLQSLSLYKSGNVCSLYIFSWGSFFFNFNQHYRKNYMGNMLGLMYEFYFVLNIFEYLFGWTIRIFIFRWQLNVFRCSWKFALVVLHFQQKWNELRNISKYMRKVIFYEDAFIISRVVILRRTDRK